MLPYLIIFATACLLSAVIIWWRTPNDMALPACEERDAYVASLWTGTIAFGALLAIGATGLLLLLAGLHYLKSAARP
jgi:hypothetical protein